MSQGEHAMKGGCCMADLEQASSILRMAHKDFNALTGIIA